MLSGQPVDYNSLYRINILTGGVAQMVERSLSMREVPGSIPGASKFFFFYLIYLNKFLYCY